MIASSGEQIRKNASRYLSGAGEAVLQGSLFGQRRTRNSLRFNSPDAKHGCFSFERFQVIFGMERGKEVAWGASSTETLLARGASSSRRRARCDDHRTSD